MTRLTATEPVQSVLERLDEAAEIYDQRGNMLGVYVPAGLKPRPKQDDELTISDEEIKRRLMSLPKGGTTHDVFERLLMLTPDEPTRAQLRELIRDLKERDACASP